MAAARIGYEVIMENLPSGLLQTIKDFMKRARKEEKIVEVMFNIYEMSKERKKNRFAKSSGILVITRDTYEVDIYIDPDYPDDSRLLEWKLWAGLRRCLQQQDEVLCEAVNTESQENFFAYMCGGKSKVKKNSDTIKHALHEILAPSVDAGIYATMKTGNSYFDYSNFQFDSKMVKWMNARLV